MGHVAYAKRSVWCFHAEWMPQRTMPSPFLHANHIPMRSTKTIMNAAIVLHVRGSSWTMAPVLRSITRTPDVMMMHTNIWISGSERGGGRGRRQGGHGGTLRQNERRRVAQGVLCIAYAVYAAPTSPCGEGRRSRFDHFRTCCEHTWDEQAHASRQLTKQLLAIPAPSLWSLKC
jgi:hypothetical protein